MIEQKENLAGAISFALETEVVQHSESLGEKINSENGARETARIGFGILLS